MVLRFDVIKGCPNPCAIKLSNSKLGLRLNNYRPTIEIKKSEMITIPKKNIGAIRIGNIHNSNLSHYDAL